MDVNSLGCAGSESHVSAVSHARAITALSSAAFRQVGKAVAHLGTDNTQKIRRALPADAGCFAHPEVWRTHQRQSNIGADDHYCALPDLVRLNRYERRAAARSDQAIRALTQSEE